MKSHPFRIYVEGKDTEIRMPSQPYPLATIHSVESQAFFNHLIEAMLDFDGIGIAAPQVGQNVQVFVVDRSYVDAPFSKESHLVLINPRMVSVSERTTRWDEGCLSVPGIYGSIERPSKIRMKAYTRDGSLVDIKAKGKFAWVLQHEYDHLEGILYIDKADELYEPEPLMSQRAI